MKSGNHTTIFIVDDDRLFTATLKNMIIKSFAEEDPDIFIFETGELCELSINQRPGIALVDYHLNNNFRDVMNGVSTINMIRTKSPATEIIMFTREENEDIVKEVFKHGAHDYVVKNESMFHRISVSLQQCKRLMNTKRELKVYKDRGLLALILMTLLGVASLLQFFAPQLF